MYNPLRVRLKSLLETLLPLLHQLGVLVQETGLVLGGGTRTGQGARLVPETRLLAHWGRDLISLGPLHLPHEELGLVGRGAHALGGERNGEGLYVLCSSLEDKVPNPRSQTNRPSQISLRHLVKKKINNNNNNNNKLQVNSTSSELRGVCSVSGGVDRSAES